MTPIKLLISDVDGTLVTKDKVLTSRAREAVARLRAAGIQFTITSGRPPRGMAMLTEALKLNVPIAPFNGGMFVEPDLTTVLEQRTIPLAVASEVVDYLLEAGLDVWVYRGADWFSVARRAPCRARAAVGAVRAIRGQRTSQRPRWRSQDRRGQRRRATDGAQRRRAAPPRRAIRFCHMLTALLPRLHSPRREQGHGRATGLELFHISTSEIAAIGDSPNDVLMFGVPA